MTKQFDKHPTNKKQGKVLLVAMLSVVLLIVLSFRLGTFQFLSSTSEKSLIAAASQPGPVLDPAERNELRPVGNLPLPVVDMNRVLTQNPFRGFNINATTQRNPVGETTADHTTAVAGRLVQQSSSTQHLITIDSTNLDNPEVSSQAIQLSAIMTGGLRPTALIGDKLLYENDCLENGWRIVAIQSGKIVVQTTVIE